MPGWMNELARQARAILGAGLVGVTALSLAAGAASAGGSGEGPAPMAPLGQPIAPPPVPPDMPKAEPTTLTRTTAVPGRTSPGKLVNTRLLPPPPRPFPGEKFAIKHVIEGKHGDREKAIRDPAAEEARQREAADRKKRKQRGLEKPAAPRHGGVTSRGNPGPMFPGSDGQSSPFIPPDPTLAVGFEHVILTANSLLSVYYKDGTPVQEIMLFGSNGLFGSQGAGGFVFDPKCLYDAHEDRFVVVALEYYEAQLFSSILIALSAPGDPQTWTTFRSDSKTDTGGGSFSWFDYPGFGYDEHAYYVTGNLFSFGDFPSYKGVKFRIFNKQRLLAGNQDNFADLNDFTRTFSSVQVAQHFGASPTPYFVSIAGNSTKTFVQMHSIKNPLNNPSRFTKIVTLSQSYDYPDFISACCEDLNDPGCGAGFINTVDDRVFNATWRDGNFYTAHHFTNDENDTVTARWYQIATNDWPTDSSASPSYVQGGDIPGGTTSDDRPIHTFFPAIHVNEEGEVGVVLGMAPEGECAQVALSGRLPGDPPGMMSNPISIKSSDGADQDEGRWGDYQGIALDPLDNKTFWGIAQYNKKFSDQPGNNDGWGLWIYSFDLEDLPTLFAVDDGFETAIESPSGIETRIDVQVNDYDTSGHTFDIDAFDATSAAGGTITLSVGTGPDGRDELAYTSPAQFSGEDTFHYTLRNSEDATDDAIVKVTVLAGQFLEAEDPGLTEGGVDVRYSIGNEDATDFPAVVPDPYLTTSVPSLSFAQADGVPFANSGRSAGTVAVFTGYLQVPTTEVYEFCLLRGSGASLIMQDVTIIDDQGVHIPADGPICGQVGLEAGAHSFRVEFFHATGPHGLMLYATGGGLEDELVPGGWYLRPADCTADFDETGFVDIDDYIAFVFDFELGVDSADVDGSGFVDTDDFDYFVCAFINGCDC
ncbi:MAG: hypothetical protein IT435_17460 [Phycisphaerales bacterium]|nr:hypothetical protein [Phycisphaerales bacterium]